MNIKKILTFVFCFISLSMVKTFAFNENQRAQLYSQSSNLAVGCMKIVYQMARNANSFVAAQSLISSRLFWNKEIKNQLKEKFEELFFSAEFDLAIDHAIFFSENLQKRAEVAVIITKEIWKKFNKIGSSNLQNFLSVYESEIKLKFETLICSQLNNLILSEAEIEQSLVQKTLTEMQQAVAFKQNVEANQPVESIAEVAAQDPLATSKFLSDVRTTRLSQPGIRPDIICALCTLKHLVDLSIQNNENISQISTSSWNTLLERINNLQDLVKSQPQNHSKIFAALKMVVKCFVAILRSIGILVRGTIARAITLIVLMGLACWWESGDVKQFMNPILAIVNVIRVGINLTPAATAVTGIAATGANMVSKILIHMDSRVVAESLMPALGFGTLGFLLLWLL